ncbi:MAG: TIGR03067 domain-containing protein [Gemmataceae bacterium]|nr:TIGR03067 domain-containing protein [Gemmataceae bacterium]
MKAHCLAIIAVLAGLSSAPADDKKDAPKLSGKWQPTSMQLGESKVPAEQLSKTSLVIDGDNYSVMAGNTPDKGTVKRDDAAKPKAMDITGTEGPNKGKTLLAIYELDGDTLKVCYALEGKRPTEFKASSDKILLVTYKRVK